MKYIFIDTNIYVYSAISSQKQHQIESFEKLRKVLENNRAILLVPEIVRVEFERKIEGLYQRIKKYFEDLFEEINTGSDRFKLPPYLDGEKKKLLAAMRDIGREKDKKYENMKNEINSLLSLDTVRTISLDSEIFIRAYIRGLKGEKPFKIKTEDSRKKDELIEDVGWLSDALIVESLISESRKLGGENTLIFCSNNVKDFAVQSKDQKKHLIHPQIKKDLKFKEIVFYSNFPDVLEMEFEEVVSKGTKQSIDKAEKFYSGSLLDLIRSSARAYATMQAQLAPSVEAIRQLQSWLNLSVDEYKKMPNLMSGAEINEKEDREEKTEREEGNTEDQ
jgi:hypothetical protein